MATILDSIHIVSSPDVLGGKPRLEGRRIGVHQIAYHVIYEGWGLRQLDEAYQLNAGEIHAALSYYYSHRDDIDSLIHENVDTVPDSQGKNDLLSLLDVYLTTGEVADRLDITERAVRKLIESRTLPARKVAGAWLIHPQDLERDAVKYRKPGRPPST